MIQLDVVVGRGHRDAGFEGIHWRQDKDRPARS